MFLLIMLQLIHIAVGKFKIPFYQSRSLLLIIHSENILS